MAEAFIVRRGGAVASIEFKIVDGTTQPPTAAENTIWVNTGVEITSWAFTKNEPETIEEGMVWFNLSGGPASIPVDKNGNIVLTPFECKQRNGGEWTRCDAYVYQSGSWVLFAESNLYLYMAGNILEEITGGWVAEGKKSASSGGGTAKMPTITEGDDGITFVVSGGTYNVGVVYLANSFDIRKYKTISVTLSEATVAPQFCVWTSIGYYGSDNTVVYQNTGTGAGERTYDISGLSSDEADECFIGFMISTGAASSATVKLTELKLIP